MMKTQFNPWAGRRAFAFGLAIATNLLLLAALTARGDAPYTSTGWVIGVPSPGIWHTNASGQVLVRGNVHLARVESSDPRLTGQRLILVDGAAQADGSVLLYGNCYQQVGTWDPARTNFTATGGLWEISYRGVMQTDNSLQLHLVGSGSGGTIEGLRLEEDLTRTACPGILDPTCPYQYTGTVKSAPVNTTEVVDNFDPGHFTGTTSGSGTVVETNGQFIALGDFRVPTRTIMDSYFFGWPNKTWTVPDGMTREWRADLVSLDENATNPVLAILGVGTYDGMYGFHKGRDFAYLWKWLPGLGNGISMFSCERAAVRNTNVVLALALTRVQPNLVITARVLDKADPNTVLYQGTVVDTPKADQTVTVDQFQALTGVRLEELVPDVPGPPLSQFRVESGVFQYTDGTQPAPSATFDNFEVRTSEIPPVGIEPAVRLSWPASATINYAPVGAPTVQGPWLPVQGLEIPGMQQVTVPLSGSAQFFHLQQAP
jgi:hypothetical protein